MGLDEGDRIVALSRLPKEEISDEEAQRAMEEPKPAPPEAERLPSGDGGETEEAGGEAEDVADEVEESGVEDAEE
jgi:hypothetical protein